MCLGGAGLDMFSRQYITTQLPQSIYIVRVVMAACLGSFVADAVDSQNERTRMGEIVVSGRDKKWLGRYLRGK